jgi:hypothetical protein
MSEKVADNFGVRQQRQAGHNCIMKKVIVYVLDQILLW